MHESYRGPIGFCLEGMSGPHSGAWYRAQSLVKSLTQFGFSVHVLGEIGRHEGARNWGVESISLIPKLNKWQRVMGRTRRLQDFANRTGCKILHLEAHPFVGLRGAKTLGAIHDLRALRGGARSFLRPTALYLRFFFPIVSRRLSLWLALSEFGKQELQARLGIPAHMIRVVPPSVASPAFSESSERPNSPSYVLALGHLETRKNIATLIRASGEESWPAGLELWIAGRDNGALNTLRLLAETAGGSIRFLGPVDEVQKWELLRWAQIVAVPSELEGFGIVAVEGPLAGSVTLVSDRTALPELAGHPLAIVDCYDYREWARRIAFLTANPRISREILKAQQTLASRFTGDFLGPLMNEIYSSLARKEKP